MLSISEYRRATKLFITMRDSADHPAMSLESLEGLAGLLHGAIVRAGSTVTLEQFSDAVSPADIIEGLVALLKSSTEVSIPVIDVRLN